MAPSVYFLDASALVHYYAHRPAESQSRLIRARIADLYAAAVDSRRRVTLQIPNICMAECAGAFARLCFETGAFGKGDRAEDAYRRLRGQLLNDVRSERLLHSYELKRVHFHEIEDIFRRDYTMPAPRQGRRLSAHDALILAMTREYRDAHPEQSVFLVTNDRRLSDFCRANAPDYPAAVHISTQAPI